MRLSVVKSLFSFAHKLGYVVFNVAAAIKLPKCKDHLAERILSEDQVLAMLANEPNPRNYAMLRLLYSAGLRAAELCGLKWRDVQHREHGGQLTVYGKGGKTRHVILKASTFHTLINLRDDAGPDGPLFRSRNGGHLCTTQVYYIVRNAARRAGIEGNISPHWLRHAHASHALDRGAPIHLVKDTLGHSSIETTGRYSHAHPGDGSSLHLVV